VKKILTKVLEDPFEETPINDGTKRWKDIKKTAKQGAKWSLSPSSRVMDNIMENSKSHQTSVVGAPSVNSSQKRHTLKIKPKTKEKLMTQMSALLESSAQIESILHHPTRPEFMRHGGPVTITKDLHHSRSLAPSELRSELSLFSRSVAPTSSLDQLDEHESEETERSNP